MSCSDIQDSCHVRKCFVNGMVFTPAGPIRTDILVDGDKIAAVGDRSVFALQDSDEFIDCSEHLIMPGFIDAHCHIQLDTGIFATQDDWWDGSQEAARGGVTTVIDFVGPQPGEELGAALKFRLKQAEMSLVDYTFHMTVLDDSEQSLEGIDKCPEWGLSSLKLYTTYKPNYYLSDDAVTAILERAAKARLTVLIHCENDAIVTHETAKHRSDNLWRSYPELRPWEAEAEAAARMIALACHTGARLVIAHNSCPETLKLVQKGKKLNPNLFNETAPQYLMLDKTCNTDSSEPWRYILQPPLRHPDLSAEMRGMMKEHAADMFITDHCSYTREQKLNSQGGTPGGLPGFETLFPVLAAGLDMPLHEIVRNLTENPAKIYGLWPRKGAIAPGFDADLVVVEDKSYVIDENQLKCFAGYSPFHEIRARGIIKRVFRRGDEIIRDGCTLGKKGTGRFLKAVPAWNN